MCGIAGIFNYGSAPADDRDVACRMRDAMTHRGPDDAGVYQSADRRVVLVHRRLSIVVRGCRWSSVRRTLFSQPSASLSPRR